MEKKVDLFRGEKVVLEIENENSISSWLLAEGKAEKINQINNLTIER